MYVRLQRTARLDLFAARRLGNGVNRADAKLFVFQQLEPLVAAAAPENALQFGADFVLPGVLGVLQRLPFGVAHGMAEVAVEVAFVCRDRYVPSAFDTVAVRTRARRV